MLTRVSTKPDPNAPTAARGKDGNRLRLCRYLHHTNAGVLERCTGEVVEAEAEIELCVKHLSRTVEFLQRKGLA